jgi:hypothetical protein
MVTGETVKSAEGDLMIGEDDQIAVIRQLTKEVSPAILNDKINNKKDCGRFNHCAGCKRHPLYDDW